MSCSVISHQRVCVCVDGCVSPNISGQGHHSHESHDGHQQLCMTVSRGWLIRLYAYNNCNGIDLLIVLCCMFKYEYIKYINCEGVSSDASADQVHLPYPRLREEQGTELLMNEVLPSRRRKRSHPVSKQSVVPNFPTTNSHPSDRDCK
jgi:hypothetical protein